MKVQNTPSSKSLGSELIIYFFLIVGAFIAAFAIEVFLIPNRLIDGGMIGLAMIFANLFGTQYLAYFTLVFNLPFVYLAYKYIGRVFVIHMFFSLVFFALSIYTIEHYMPWAVFKGDMLEVVVIGGALLGIGIGLIIRYGACLDGSEILGIICNKLTGFTVGQVVLVINIFVFTAAGFAFQDWHPALLSLITFMVVSKIMDTVIVGFDETKSVLIISSQSKRIADAIMHELGLGLTIMYGRGGFSGDAREILYVIAERLQLADLKELIHREDPTAFIAIENLHEVANGNQNSKYKKTRMSELVSKALGFKNH